MEKADEYRETLPEEQRSGLDPLLESWKSEREKARAEMLAHLNSRNYHDFIWAFNSFLNTPGEGNRSDDQNPPAPDRVYEVAPVLIYTRLGAVRAYDKILGHATIEQLHALRIEFKKLRYAVEFFREVLGEESKSIIGELKNLQDHLGELHDADIATQILREFLQTWEAEQESLPAGEQKSPAGILNYLAARFNERQQLMTTFPEAWQRFSEPEFRKNLALAVSKL
jgi:CHAD domain-containing protein